MTCQPLRASLLSGVPGVAVIERFLVLDYAIDEILGFKPQSFSLLQLAEPTYRPFDS